MRNYIKNEVKKLIDEYKTNDPFELIDYLGITFIKFPLDGNLNGYYVEQLNICVDSDLSDEEMIRECA